MGNEAVLQLIAGDQVHQNVRVLGRATDELVVRLIAERCVRDEGAELTAAGVNRKEERGNILRLNACGQNTASYRAQSTNVECAFFFAGGGGCHAVHALSIQSLYRVAAHQEQIETNATETLLRHLRQRRSQSLTAEDLTVTLQSLTHLSGSHLQSSRGLSSRNSRSGNNRLGRSHNGRRNSRSGHSRLGGSLSDRCRRNLSGCLGSSRLGRSRYRRTSRTRQQRRRSTRHRSQRLTRSTLTSRQASLTLRRACLLSSLKSLLTSLQLSRNILRQLVLERLRR